MGWFSSPQVIHRIEALEHETKRLREEREDLRVDLSDALRGVRQLDLDIVGLEEKVKSFTGRRSVSKRKDRKEPENEAPPIDINQAIRDGKLSSWP